MADILLRLAPIFFFFGIGVVLRQTALGLQPFSALGGGLRVADQMEIHFQLEGHRLRTDR